MYRLWHSLVLAPVLAGSIALSASAQERTTSIDELSKPATLKGQVTSVSQLSDVRPTDWAFQALQSLVERYGCIAGYPDRTYRGNRALTRFEFAAGLNACLDRVNELIAASTADLVKKEDLAALQKLQEEFAAELATVRGQVDSLEARTTTLERQQFSTTSKLTGEVIFSASQAFGADRAVTSDQQRVIDAAATPAARTAARNTAITGSATNSDRDVRENTTFSNRVRIAFDTSFSGRDRLRTQLQARNITAFSGTGAAGITGTNMTRLGYDGTNNNTIELRRLEYRFPLGDQTTVFLGTGTNDGLEFNDSIPTLSPFESSGSGSISRFGRFNPIYRSSSGTGIIVNHRLGREFTVGNRFTLSLGYLVPTGDAQDPSLDRGLFSGSYAAIAQLVYQPTPNLGIGFTYANGYFNTGSGVTGSTGSAFANNPFNSNQTINSAGNVPTSTNQYGVQANIRLSPGLALAGWAGLTDAQARRTVGATAATRTVREGDRATIFNWAVGLAFPDLFSEGSLGGIIFGMPPKVTSSDFGLATPTAVSARREDRSSSYHLEVFYRYRLSDNISITPGAFVIFNPEGNSANNAIYVGTLRTTFTF
ncbi:iron uptake porin [Leptolyngbya sp. NIES-2104]|uniref:iron uptake porin n=1 Tax=Leptolyngbya sp. NIES-2104 TaxID=1552121 RepID=UPI0006EC7DC1|nr:iron uptake porin [Leptolyngbya sp. NIES-2104]GAP93845.1 possible porin [Leptolyngbya sp. NIES-2104]